MGIIGASYSDIRQLYEDRCVDYECFQVKHNWIMDDEIFDEVRKDDYINVESSGMFEGTLDSTQTLSEDQLILLPYRVHGYTLRTRFWGQSQAHLYVEYC